MNIVEFLEARIAEDEAAVERRGDGSHSIHATDAYGAFNSQCPDCLGLPARERVLAECKAKRVILKQAEEADSETEYSISQSCINEAECEAARATAPGKLIREALAAVYADHPDYREEWRHA